MVETATSFYIAQPKTRGDGVYPDRTIVVVKKRDKRVKRAEWRRRETQKKYDEYYL